MKAIGTWKMAYEAFMHNIDSNHLDEFLINSIKYAEDMDNVHTVGNFSFPNENGFLELDAAFMDGDSLMFGSVMGLRNHSHPIEVAYKLSKLVNNNILVGDGACIFAQESNINLIEPIVYNDDPSKIDFNQANHDTCGMVGLCENSIKIAISSSGRKYKHVGRVGDSPLIGNGFYADSKFAGIVFTGDGEAIARGCLAKTVIDDFKHTNDLQLSLSTVCDEYLNRIKDFYDEIPSFCAVGVDKEGNFASYTSLDDFPFAIVIENDVKLMYSTRINGKIKTQEVDSSFLKNYKGD